MILLNERTKEKLEEAWSLLDEAYNALEQASGEAGIDLSGEIDDINAEICNIMMAIQDIKG